MGAVSGREEQSQVKESNLRWRGAERSLIEGSGPTVPGGGKLSQDEGAIYDGGKWSVS